MVNGVKTSDPVLIAAYWSGRGGTIRSALLEGRALLGELRLIMPELTKLFLWGRNRKQSAWLNSEWSDFDTIVGEKLLRDGRRFGGHGSGMDFVPQLGCMISVSNLDGENTAEGHISVSLTTSVPAGAPFPCSAVVTVSPNGLLQYTTNAALEGVLGTLVKHFHPDRAIVTRDSFSSKVCTYQEFQAGVENIGLLTYFRNGTVLNIASECCDVVPMNDGTLLRLPFDMSTLSDPEAVRLAREVRSEIFGS